MKLFADRPFDEVSESLYSILESISEDYLADAKIDLFEYADKDKTISMDDEFGPLTPAIEKTFRAALIHVDLAVKVREEGDSETAWARLEWASRLVGRIQRAEEIETAAKRQAELTYTLKIKTIELVSCLRPEGGWATHEEAYECIAPELSEFRESLIDDNKKKKEEEITNKVDLIQKMQRWRKDDPLIRAAFAGNSAKRIAERTEKAGT